MEHVMASSGAFGESEPPQQVAQIIKSDVRIGPSLQYCKQKLLMFAHFAVLWASRPYGFIRSSLR